MTVDRRWDTDTRGRGVRDAAAALPDLEALATAMGEPYWVAEDPELHLVPHVQRAAADLGVDLGRVEVSDGILQVWIKDRPASYAETRQLVFGLLGSFAETSTHVRERRDEFEIVTGVLAGDSGFASHGHIVRIRFGDAE